METGERPSSGGVDGLEITFDDERLVADAGLVLPALLCRRGWAPRRCSRRRSVARKTPASGRGRAPRRSRSRSPCWPRADSIDDTDRLCAGASGAVLEFRPAAASTAGKWLRRLGFGQVRQLDAAAGELLRRAWGAGARPERLVIDLDSAIAPVYGRAKAGAE